MTMTSFACLPLFVCQEASKFIYISLSLSEDARYCCIIDDRHLLSTWFLLQIYMNVCMCVVVAVFSDVDAFVSSSSSSSSSSVLICFF